MAASGYTDIKFEIKGQIGIIKVILIVLPPSPFIEPVLQKYVNLFRFEAILTETQFNRPKALNSFGGNLIADTIAALRVLNEHPDTVFTVLTGEGRFFSAGADVRGVKGITEVCLLKGKDTKTSIVLQMHYRTKANNSISQKSLKTSEKRN
jgi:peroxisomal 3,2-trans-enoyl-CoA isomerase